MKQVTFTMTDRAYNQFMELSEALEEATKVMNEIDHEKNPKEFTKWVDVRIKAYEEFRDFAVIYFRHYCGIEVEG